ncbi:MAG: hypothetical protein C0434_00100 [Xanthomonadaceae bacterium]|nr:hypothetical protein [Xanthomonadaceae bacterium]
MTMAMPFRIARLVAAAGLLLAGMVTAAAAPSYAPRPAMMAPRAASSLMLDVAAVEGRFVAVGERGQILRSIDGKTWTQVPVPVRAALTAVSFVDARHGWAVGHDAVILATRDGGASWNLQSYEPALEKPLLDVLFTDTRNGFAVGAFGLFLRTVDGGDNWQAVHTAVIDDEELNLHAVVRLGNGDLLIVGEQGRLLLSTDVGRSWTKLRSPVESTLFGASAYGRGGALICGLQGQAWVSGAVRDGGWRPIKTGTRHAFHACTVSGRDRALLAGAQGIVLLADPVRRDSKRLKAPAGGAWSAMAIGTTALVLAGERGVHAISLVPGR